MLEEKINSEYYNWLCEYLYFDEYKNNYEYSNLISYLYETPFIYTIEMDENRLLDGMNLRYSFANEYDYSESMISKNLNSEISVLEVMIALSNRILDQFIEDSDEKNTNSYFFWNMIDSLGLTRMNNSNFNLYYTDKTIEKFLNRDYKSNGSGGLFTVYRNTQDMRNIEIWYQMCAYLNEIL